MPEPRSGESNHQSDSSGATTHTGTKCTVVPAEEREEEVLDFLLEKQIALPPRAIYRGLKVDHNITFSHRTVENILARLLEDGQVMRCDKDALDDGRIEPVPEDASGRRTYYAITDRGSARLAGELDDGSA